MIKLGTPLRTDGSPPDSRRTTSRILVGICSCSRYPEKRQAVRSTWLALPSPNVECQFFIGGRESLADEPDTVVLPVDDSYEGLPEKVLAYFAHALEHSGFDWLFKCDDDTYLVLDRLHDLVTDEGEIVGNESLRDRGSPSGGAGYLLSRRVVEQLVADASLAKRGPEDIIVGEAAIKHGATPVWTDRLRWNAVPCPRRDNSLITAHWCSPERLLAIHTNFIRQPVKTVQASHPDWRDCLELYDDGIFCRRSSGCSGLWEENRDGTTALRWFDWDEEVLVPSDDGPAKVVKLGAMPSGNGRSDKTIVV